MSASTKALHVHATGPDVGKLVDASDFFDKNPPRAAMRTWWGRMLVAGVSELPESLSIFLGVMPFAAKVHRAAFRMYSAGSLSGDFLVYPESGTDVARLAVSGSTRGGIVDHGASPVTVPAGMILYVNTPVRTGTVGTGLEVYLEIEPTY